MPLKQMAFSVALQKKKKKAFFTFYLDSYNKCQVHIFYCVTLLENVETKKNHSWRFTMYQECSTFLTYNFICQEN